MDNNLFSTMFAPPPPPSEQEQQHSCNNSMMEKDVDQFAATFSRNTAQTHLNSLMMGVQLPISSISNNSNEMMPLSSNNGNGTNLVSDLDRVLNILDTAEDICGLEAPQVPPAQVPSQVLSQDSMMFNLEPTPLGPQGFVSPQASLSSMDVLDLFGPVHGAPHISMPAPKRRRSSKELPMGSMPAPVLSAAATTTAAVSPSPAADQGNSEEERFRPYQSDQWKDRFQDLIDFKAQNGHCLVPHNFPENQQLAQWIKRQRYQYKLKSNGRHSTLTDERQVSLENMGFVWDSHKAAWIEKFENLKTFFQTYKHCSVPSNYTDRSLAIWVKCQRRQYKLFQQGARSTMNQERFMQLEMLGFDWNPRNL